MRLVEADHWLEKDESFTSAPCVSTCITWARPFAEDLIVAVPGEGVIFSGDILFAGRIPFVGEADSKEWLVPHRPAARHEAGADGHRHGQVSRDPGKDLT
jgi:hypothetical protein